MREQDVVASGGWLAVLSNNGRRSHLEVKVSPYIQGCKPSSVGFWPTAVNGLPTLSLPPTLWPLSFNVGSSTCLLSQDLGLMCCYVVMHLLWAWLAYTAIPAFCDGAEQPSRKTDIVSRQKDS